MIDIAIVEDNADDAKTLKKYVERALSELGVTGRITVFEQAIPFIEGYKGNFGIVFMDIELPDLDGMVTAHKLREIDPNTVLIFVTNMARFAVNGYEVDALDFMVKPISYENLHLKLIRAVKRAESNHTEKLVLQGKSNATVLSIPSIKYVEVMNHKLTVKTTEGEVAVTGTLSRIEEKLLPYGFSRCNSCYLVNLRFVTGVTDNFAHVGGENLPISRSRKKQFLKDIADYLGGSF